MKVAVIGGGPAGLMAAEILSAAGLAVTLYERMPNVGRKFLLAGRGGLNLTHSEDFEKFLARYGAASGRLRAILEAFAPSALIAWAEGLGQTVFTGSSGRVFPKALKASPLLRAWLARLRAQGVNFRTRCEWLGWDDDGALVFRNAEGAREIATPDATILALGGASWPKLGSDGGWTKTLMDEGVAVAPLRPANCGFAVAWSEIFRTRFAGTPLKNIALRFGGQTVRGEAVVTDYGIEGGAVYALSAALRDAIEDRGTATLEIDLRPQLTAAEIAHRLARPRGKQSLANFLRKALHLSPVEISLLRECGDAPGAGIKSVALTLTAPQPLARAISTSGGVAFASLDEDLMLMTKPKTFVAGEMLDWEAPTGGYLLQASFATGAAAARGVLRLASGADRP